MEAPTREQAAATEAYRQSPYPAMVHVRNHPDRFATIARLAGMTPPDVNTARVLEIGAGNGLNLLSLAQAHPDGQFTGFDIEADAIADGNALRVAAGIRNARLEVLDLLDADGRLDGEYDYIIAHGVFAWVPPAVAEALLALIGRCLSPQGIAMVSFNALPGCYLRQGLRDMLLRASAGATTPEERLARGQAAMAAVVEPRDGDGAAAKAFRETVRLALKGIQRVLLHDEMGADWHPRHLPDVLAQAAPYGLAFLGDPTVGRTGEAFVDEANQGADVQRAVEARACANDEAEFCSFRRLLLIRRSAAPARVPQPAVIEELFAASAAGEMEPDTFVNGNDRVQITHAPLAELVRRLIAARPARVRVRDLAITPDLFAPLLSLFDNNIVSLHTVDAPFATVPGDRPRTSPLARAMIARGLTNVATLAHRPLQLDPSVMHAVAALDGGSDDGRFDAIIQEAGISRDDALAELTMLCLLMPGD